MSIRTNVLVLATILAGCAVGTNVKTLQPVQNGGGISVVIELSEIQTWPEGTMTTTPFQRIDGELLSATEEYLVVNGRAIVQLHYSQVANASFPGLKHLGFSGSGPSAEVLQELKLYSRYPAGISSEVMESLLAAYNQDSLYVFR